MSDKPIVILDIETTGLNRRRDSIIGIGYKYLGQEAQYLQLDGWREGDRRLDLDKVLPLLAELKGCRLVLHNAAFDVPFIKNYYGVDLTENIFVDTMLLKHTCDEQPPFGLKDIGVKLFGEAAKSEQKDLLESIKANGGTATKKCFELYKADPEIIAKYCKQDLNLTEQVYLHYMPILESEGLSDFFFNQEVMPLYAQVTIPMEAAGLQLDMPKIQTALAEITEDLKIVEKEVQEQLALVCSDFKSWFFDKQYPVKASGSFLQYLATMENEDLPKTASGKLSISKKTFPLIKSEKLKNFISTKTLDAETIDAIRYKMHHKKMHSDTFINIQSKDHLRKIVFEYLKEKPSKFTHRGAWTLDDKFLQTLKGKYAFIEPLLIYNKLAKIKSAYIERFINESENGIFYTSFQQHRTISGRYGSNIQQLPKPLKSNGHPLLVKYTNMIRHFFIPGEGNKFVGADQNSLEVRVFAHISGEKAIQEGFANGEDFYSRIALSTFGLTEYSAQKDAPNYLGKVYPEARQKAKAFGLGIAYGLTGYKISKEMNISQKEGDQIVNNYLKAYPSLAKWMRDSEQRAIDTGVIQTIAGRKRRLPEAQTLFAKHGDSIKDDLLLWKRYNEMPTLYSEAKMDRRVFKNALNNSKNMQIQSLAASIINQSSVKINQRLKEIGSDARIVINLHDELVVRCKESEVSTVKSIMQFEMENIFKLDVPLIAVPKEGDTYGQTKDE